MRLTLYPVQPPRDALGTPAAACRWLLAQGLLRRDARVNEEERTTLIELRESIRSLAWSQGGGRMSGTALARLNRLGSAATIGAVFDAAGNVTSTGRKGDAADAVSTLLAIVCDAIRDWSWSRLKLCRDDTCRWAFYDASRNRVGTWCSMGFCGNRAKTRAYRQRRRIAS